MLGVLIPIYLVPAGFIMLGLWMLMRLTGEIGLAIGARRVVFVIATTVLLAPAIVPAGIIIPAYVPYGVLALSGELPMRHQQPLQIFAIGSFLVTALAATAASFALVRDRGPGLGRTGTVRFAIPALVIAGLLGSYYSLSTDRAIPGHIDRELIVTEYSELLDVLAATLDIDEKSAIQEERDRIAEFLEVDTVIVSVRLFDERLPTHLAGSRDVFDRFPGPGSRGCSSSAGSYRDHGLMRCTRDATLFGGYETLEYRHQITVDAEVRTIMLEFDYERFLDRHPDPEG